MKTIDVTPTWSALLPALLDVYANCANSKAEHKRLSAKNIEHEFKRMAEAADNWNEYCKSKKS